MRKLSFHLLVIAACEICLAGYQIGRELPWVRPTSLLWEIAVIVNTCAIAAVAWHIRQREFPPPRPPYYTAASTPRETAERPAAPPAGRVDRQLPPTHFER